MILTRYINVIIDDIGISDNTYRSGIIAGGMSDGSIHLFDVNSILSHSSSTQSAISKIDKHRGAVRVIDWNRIEPNLIASCGDDGEVYTYDVASPTQVQSMSPYDTVNRSVHQPPVTALSWNQKLVYILAAGTEQGETIVYDLRTKREKLRIRNHSRVSMRTASIVWSPDSPVNLAIAYAASNVVELWDVRKSMQPIGRLENIHSGSGILSIDWSTHDSNILYSSGDDGRIVSWNTQTATYCEQYSVTQNTNVFDLNIHPTIPNLVSTSSFDGKVSLYNISHTGLNHTPKWLKRPCGVASGFGGRIVSFHHNTIPSTESRPSQSTAPSRPGSPNRQSQSQSTLPQQTLPPSITISQLQSDNQLLTDSHQLQSILQQQQFIEFCDSKSHDTNNNIDDTSTWKFMRILFESDELQKKLLLNELGFTAPIGSNLLNIDTNNTNTTADQRTSPHQQQLSQPQQAPVVSEDDFFNDDFSNSLPPTNDANDTITNGVSPSTGGSAINTQSNGLTNTIHKQLELPDESTYIESDDDRAIKQALVYGDFNTAVTRSISSNRMADALVIASFGAPDLWEKTRNIYFTQHSNPFIRNIMKYVVAQDLDYIVNNSDLEYWQQTLALLITYTAGDKYQSLINLLGYKLESNNNISASTICYMCSSNVDKLVEIWSSRSHGLQDGIEKLSIFGAVAARRGIPQQSHLLASKISEYAAVLSTQGGLTDAWNYLCVVLSSMPQVNDETSSALLDRIYNATNTPHTQSSQPAPPFPFAPVNITHDPQLRNVLTQYDQYKQQQAQLAAKPVQQQQQAPHMQQPNTMQQQQQQHPPQHHQQPIQQQRVQYGQSIQQQSQQPQLNQFGQPVQSSHHQQQLYGQQSAPGQFNQTPVQPVYGQPPQQQPGFNQSPQQFGQLQQPHRPGMPPQPQPSYGQPPIQQQPSYPPQQQVPPTPSQPGLPPSMQPIAPTPNMQQQPYGQQQPPNPQYGQPSLQQPQFGMAPAQQQQQQQSPQQQYGTLPPQNQFAPPPVQQPPPQQYPQAAHPALAPPSQIQSQSRGMSNMSNTMQPQPFNQPPQQQFAPPPQQQQQQPPSMPSPYQPQQPSPPRGYQPNQLHLMLELE